MDDLINDEVTEVLEQWRAGRRVAVLQLGHSVRVNPTTRQEERHKFRQLAAYAYAFQLIEKGLETEIATHEDFCFMASTLSPKALSTEEREAAESIAWKTLRRGWHNAISGFPDDRMIPIRQEIPES
jgi:hypothetical protein